MNKVERYIQTVPSIYSTQPGAFVRALIEAWAEADENIIVQLDEAKNQLFVVLATGKYLDYLGSNVGVSRIAEINLGDDVYQQLIPTLSFSPKQVRTTMYTIMEAFWGPLYSRANVTSLASEPFNFGAAVGLTGVLTFTVNNSLVTGTGTVFLAEVNPGDWIKLGTDSNVEYRKVLDVTDNEHLNLIQAYSHSGIGPASKYIAKTLDISIDGSDAYTIYFVPTFFTNTVAATAEEVANIFNNEQLHLIASIITNPLTDTVYVNLRTNTLGALGSMQVIGGNANTVLNFVTNEITIEDLSQKTVLYEINPRELVVRLPNSVPALRRVLRGSEHFHTNYGGIITAIDNIGKTVTVNFNDYAPLNTHQNHYLCQGRNEFKILSHPAGQNGIVLTFAVTDDLSVLNTTIGFAILDRGDPGFVGSFIYNPTGITYTVGQYSTVLNQVITAGNIYPALIVNDASDIPPEGGYLIFDWSKDSEEQPVQYIGRPNNSTLLLEPSYSFTKDHSVGATIYYLRKLAATVPDGVGRQYPVYITGIAEARQAVQNLLQEVKAAGVILRFIIDYPRYLFEQCN